MLFVRVLEIVAQKIDSNSSFEPRAAGGSPEGERPCHWARWQGLARCGRGRGERTSINEIAIML